MSQKLLISPKEFHKHAAILYLPASPQPELYLKKIAGVPFLLRNILVLQKLGIEKLLIWVDEQMDDSLIVFFEKIKIDPRLKLNLNRGRTLSPFSDETSFLVLDGSFLIDECQTKTEMVLGDTKGLAFLPEAFKKLSQDKELYLLQSATSEQHYGLGNERCFQAAEDRLLKSGGLNNDSFMDRLLTRFISRQLTEIFLRTSLTPNQITFLSLLIGMGAALCFFIGSYKMGMVGSILLLVSAWVDCTDGEVARLKFMVSEWGAKLDIIADNIVHCLVFFSIGMGLFSSTGDPVFIYMGMFAVVGSLVSFVFLSKTILGKKAEATKNASAETGKKEFSDHLANRDFTYFLFILALFGRLDIFIVLTAIGSNLFAVYLAWQKFQSS